MDEPESSPEIPVLRWLKRRLPSGWAVVVVFAFVGLCMLLDAAVPRLLSWVVAAASAFGLNASQQGVVAFLIFDLVPLLVFACAIFVTARRFNDQDTVWVARLPFFALVFTLPLGAEEAASALPPRGVLMEDRLGDLMIQLALGFIAVWAVYRGVRWLVDDELRARREPGV